MDKDKKKLYQILIAHVPENAVHYCLDIWTAIPFNFKVSKKRSTKLGDYRYDHRNGLHSISVNFDLNPFSFLITYIHEVAHLITTERFGRNVRSHGKEWQSSFKELMEPVLTDLIFPFEILLPLKKHMLKPKASTYSDAKLVHVLRNYDKDKGDQIALANLAKGDIFEFNDRVYTKINLRRTRVLCLQEDTSRKYLISKMALVKVLMKSDEA